VEERAPRPWLQPDLLARAGADRHQRDDAPASQAHGDDRERAGEL